MKLVRHVRTLNPTAKIVTFGGFLLDVKDLRGGPPIT